jgi:hypothetical protein
MNGELGEVPPRFAGVQKAVDARGLAEHSQ